MNYLYGSFIFLRQVWRHNPIVPIALFVVCGILFFSQFTVLQILSGATAGLQGNPLRDRIVTVWQRDQKTFGKTGISETAYYMWAPEMKTLTHPVAALYHEGLQMNTRFPDGQLRVLRGAVADAGLFPLFYVSPRIGRLFRPEEDSSRADRVVLLGLDLWRSTFKSDPNVVGKQLLINDWHYTVVGVLNSEIPSFEGVGLWLNRVSEIEDIMHNNEHWHIAFTVFAAMKKGVDVKEVEAELNIYYAALAKDLPSSFSGIVPEVVPMTKYVLANTAKSTQIMTYLGAAVIVLGLVSAMLLLVVRKIRLRTANQIRLTLGLPLSWFSVECILETGILVLSGLALAVACLRLTRLLLPYLGSKSQLGSLSRDDWPLVILLGGLMCLFLSAPQLLSFFEKSAKQRKMFLFVLVFLETATVATVFYLCGVTVRVLWDAQSDASRGYQTKNLVAARYRTFGEKYLNRESQQRFVTDISQAVSEIAGVSEVTTSTYLPLMDGAFVDYLYPANIQDRDSTHEVEVMTVRGNYFELFGAKLIAGNPFTNTAGIDSVIIDADAAKLIPCEALGCIGKPVRLFNRVYTVVGVNRPFRFRHVQRQLPQVHIPWDRPVVARSQVSVIAKTSVPSGIVFPKIREASSKVDLTITPFRIDVLDDLVTQSTQRERMMFNACLAIGVFGLFAASIGILAVTSQIIESQRRECGIRLALGETVSGVVMRLCGPVVGWAMLGIGCGIFAGTAIQDTLAATLYLKKGVDITAVVASFLIVSSTICTGLFVPVQSIFKINPAGLLKTLTDDAGTRG